MQHCRCIQSLNKAQLMQGQSSPVHIRVFVCGVFSMFIGTWFGQAICPDVCNHNIAGTLPCDSAAGCCSSCRFHCLAYVTCASIQNVASFFLVMFLPSLPSLCVRNSAVSCNQTLLGTVATQYQLKVEGSCSKWGTFLRTPYVDGL